MLVAAAEASVASASRCAFGRSPRGDRAAATLHDYIEERASTLASLSVARVVAVVPPPRLGSSSSSVIPATAGRRWPCSPWVPSAVLSLLDALARLLVVRAPEFWGVRLCRSSRVVPHVFGPMAMGDRPQPANRRGHRAEEEGDDAENILRLVENEEGEQIEEDERQMIRGIIEMEDTTAREIMVAADRYRRARRRGHLDDALRVSSSADLAAAAVSTRRSTTSPG